MFPVLAFCASKIIRVRDCFFLALTVLCAYCANRLSINLGGGVMRMGLCFVAGVVLARAYHLHPQARHGAIVSATSCVIAIVALAVDSIATFSVFGFAGLIYGLAIGAGAVDKFFSSQVVFFLGKISFSLYMSHFVVQAAMLWLFWNGDGSTSEPVLTLGLLLLVTFVIAIVFYYSVEKPSHEGGRRLLRRSKSGSELIEATPVGNARRAK